MRQFVSESPTVPAAPSLVSAGARLATGQDVGPHIFATKCGDVLCASFLRGLAKTVPALR